MGVYLAIVAFCVGGTYGLKELYAFGFANDVNWMVLVLGTVVPAVLFGISFMPQIIKMITSRSYEGVSFLSSALNIIAEVFAITGIVLNGGGADAYSPLIVLGVGQGFLSLSFPLCSVSIGLNWIGLDLCFVCTFSIGLD